MDAGVRKKSFSCPKCGFVQLEPPHLISTYCRACGDYYEVGRPGAARETPRILPPLPSFGGRRRDVFCHRCGTTHQVSSHARCTLCPGCSTSIDLVDIEFSGNASRAVDTRGRLRVHDSALLSSSWIICGSALIEGRIAGPLVSEGCVTLASRGSLASEIRAPQVIIARHARILLTIPLETDSLVVQGELHGVVNCRGPVHVRRGGVLEARLKARAVTVDKGGQLHGDLQVDSHQPGRSEPLAGSHDIRRAFSPLMAGGAASATSA